MSDILIKGMEMPKDGYHHMICIYADGTVSTGGRVYRAVPVPPHGRMIDADALIDDVRRNSESYFADDFAHEWVDKAPTIIPASEEGE